MTEIIVCGALGRMGQAIIEALREEEGLSVAGLVEAPGHPGMGRTFQFGDKQVPVEPHLPKVRGAVIIEFSVPEATLAHAREAVIQSHPLVIGTTGLQEQGQREIDHAARKIAVVQAANFSAGVNVLNSLVARAAAALGDAADVEIIEAHHNQKKDAPSGTALGLAETARAAGKERGGEVVYGRRGSVTRKPGEMGIHAVRGGDITGDHTVLFALTGERLELVHRAHGRATFARGALRAARFAKSARPGLYSMAHVLGLKEGA